MTCPAQGALVSRHRCVAGVRKAPAELGARFRSAARPDRPDEFHPRSPVQVNRTSDKGGGIA